MIIFHSFWCENVNESVKFIKYDTFQRMSYIRGAAIAKEKQKLKQKPNFNPIN